MTPYFLVKPKFGSKRLFKRKQTTNARGDDKDGMSFHRRIHRYLKRCQ